MLTAMGTNDEPGAGRGKWLALTAALLGWLFDGAEMGVFSMVGRPAIRDLLGTTDERVIGLWFGVVTAGFLVGAATGGVLFGWLGDRLGRVRAMTLSVLTYSLFTGLCGLAGEAWQVGVLRFVAALGMGGEWALGVALVMEVWPNRSRAFMAGLIGAAGNVGYMLVGFVGLGLAAMLGAVHGWLLGAGLAEQTAGWLVRNQGWRLVMLVGTGPALLTFLIRLFVPESKRWEGQRGKGHTSGWATQDLLGVLVGALGPALMVYLWAWEEPAWLHTLPVRLAGSALGLLLAAAGYTYPLMRYLQRQAAPADPDHAWRPTLRRMLLAACLSGVALLGTWGSVQWAPSWADSFPEKVAGAKEYTQIALAIGAIIATMLAAFMGDWFGRRPAYALLCLLSLASVAVLFQTNTHYGTGLLLSAVFAGGATASFYGWLPLYLPELFPTRVRATGQGFGFNFGRILAAVGALQTGNLMGLFQKDVTVGGLTFTHGYPLACTAMSLIYLVGVGIIWLAPETHGRPLPD
jgi:MFS family permease